MLGGYTTTNLCVAAAAAEEVARPFCAGKVGCCCCAGGHGGSLGGKNEADQPKRCVSAGLPPEARCCPCLTDIHASQCKVFSMVKTVVQPVRRSEEGADDDNEEPLAAVVGPRVAAGACGVCRRRRAGPHHARNKRGRPPQRPRSVSIPSSIQPLFPCTTRADMRHGRHRDRAAALFLVAPPIVRPQTRTSPHYAVVDTALGKAGPPPPRLERVGCFVFEKRIVSCTQRGPRMHER